MTKPRNIIAYLEDILDSIAKIEQYTKGISKDEFFADTQIQDSVIRRLEIIGEAVKQIPQNFKDRYPGVEWREIGDTRNILIHAYFGVDLEIIWTVVQDELPGLKEKMAKIQAESINNPK